MVMLFLCTYRSLLQEGFKNLREGDQVPPGAIVGQLLLRHEFAIDDLPTPDRNLGIHISPKQ